MQDYSAAILADPKTRAHVATKSNFDQLYQVWGEDAAGIILNPLILSQALRNRLGTPIKTELHATTGDQKVIFDEENNFYVTVVKEGNTLLLSGIGSVLGNYITKSFEELSGFLGKI